MPDRRFRLFFSRVLRTLFSCVVLLCVAPRSAAREARLVLLHTADVEGHLRALRRREVREHSGGLLKAAAVIDDIRREGPPTLLVDLGGLLSGSLEAELTGGTLPARAAAWLQYDIRLPDPLELRSERTALRGSLLGPVLLSNAEALPNQLQLSGTVVTHHLAEIDGIRVGFLGLYEVPLPAASGIRLAEKEAAERLMTARLQELRAGSPHFLVLLLRSGPEPGRVRERARHLAGRFPEFDLILGGGDGEAVRSAAWGRTLFSQAGRHARWVGRVDLGYDTVRRERTVARADLVEVGMDQEEQRELNRLLGRDLAGIALDSERIIGANVRVLEGTSRWPGQSGVQRLISEAIAGELEADVVLMEKQARAALGAGPIRVRDVFRLLPRASRLATVELNPAELRDILEENAALLGTDSFLGIFGMTYRHLPGNPVGSTIDDLQLPDGARPHGRRRLRVALHAHILEEDEEVRAVLRDVSARPTSRLTLHPLDSRRLLLDYIERVEEIDLRPQPGLLQARPGQR